MNKTQLYKSKEKCILQCKNCLLIDVNACNLSTKILYMQKDKNNDYWKKKLVNITYTGRD